MTRKLRANTRVYVVTAAQNATPVHESFWPALQQLCEHRKAELLVVPIRYKNPTSRWTASQANEEHWVEEVQPFLWNARRKLAPGLILLGDVKVQATTSDPILGFDAMTGGASAILAHTKLQLRCIATAQYLPSKILCTTGACTVANYTDTKAGKLGEFHHALAAQIVEVESDGTWHLRVVNFDTRSKSFIDLDTRYFADRHEPAPPPEALVMGDTHRDFIDSGVETATFGPRGMKATLKPKRLIWHDLNDNYDVNGHHRGNPFNFIAKRMGHSRGGADGEARRACEFVREHTTGDIESWVVCSNHNDMLRRWIINHDWKSDPTNAEFYLRLAHKMVLGTKMSAKGTEYPDPIALLFPHYIDMKGIRVLKPGDESVIAGIEVGMHGDVGTNGARGSARNLRRIGVRSVIGHSHTPAIEEGVYQTGTSSLLRLEYNTFGPSSWRHCHCLIHADGKRQLVFINKGKWRLR